jgi:hypothetical protein
MNRSSPEHIRHCLTGMRNVFGFSPGMTAEQMTWQTAKYIDLLQDIDPDVLRRACREIETDDDKFPLPARVRKIAKEVAERDDQRRKLTAPAAAGDLGAVMRNEAIRLLGRFHAECADLLLAPSREHKEFLAEAARMWGKVRPDGGLDEVDANRQRATYGHALEAWARWYLRVDLLNAAFATDAVRECYRQMTGQTIPVDHGAAGVPVVGGLIEHLPRAAE